MQEVRGSSPRLGGLRVSQLQSLWRDKHPAIKGLRPPEHHAGQFRQDQEDSSEPKATKQHTIKCTRVGMRICKYLAYLHVIVGCVHHLCKQFVSGLYTYTCMYTIAIAVGDTVTLSPSVTQLHGLLDLQPARKGTATNMK